MINFNVWTTEYRSTCKRFSTEYEAMVPIPPDGRGWKLLDSSISDNVVFWWWRRTRWTPVLFKDKVISLITSSKDPS